MKGQNEKRPSGVPQEGEGVRHRATNGHGGNCDGLLVLFVYDVILCIVGGSRLHATALALEDRL